jgi:hypothetical protein
MDQTDDLTDAQLEARYAQLDARLRGMTSANERHLLGTMGRMPDSSYQVGDGQTKILQWRWDTQSCSPKRRTSEYSPTPGR